LRPFVACTKMVARAAIVSALCIHEIAKCNARILTVNVLVMDSIGVETPSSGKPCPLRAPWSPQGTQFAIVSANSDREPLDVLVLNEEPVVSNTLPPLQSKAVFAATHTEKEVGKPVLNDRIVGQAIGKESPLEVRRLKLEPAMVKEISVFSETYYWLNVKKSKVLGIVGQVKCEKCLRLRSRHIKKSKM